MPLMTSRPTESVRSLSASQIAESSIFSRRLKYITTQPIRPKESSKASCVTSSSSSHESCDRYWSKPLVLLYMRGIVAELCDSFARRLPSFRLS